MDRSDLIRWRRRASARLGLAPPPPGYRPPRGASMGRVLFAFIWLILGVIQTSVFLSSRSWAMLALAVLWFGLAALHFGRARRLVQAEHRAEPDLDD
jgi:hypothetical protein